MKTNVLFRRIGAVLLMLLLLIAAVSGCAPAAKEYDALFRGSSLPEGPAETYAQATDLRYLPEENAPGARDYAYMWWHGGMLRYDKLLMVQTGSYGMSFDPRTAQITRLGAVSAQISAADAAKQDDSTVMNLPAVTDMTHGVVSAGGETATVSAVVPLYVNGEIAQVKDERATALRFLDSGTFLQRADLMTLSYKAAPQLTGRLEFACSPDSMQYTYQAQTKEGSETCELFFSLKLDPSFDRHEFLGQNVLAVFDQDFNGYLFSAAEDSGVTFLLENGTLRIAKAGVKLTPDDWQGFTVEIKPAANLNRQMIRRMLAADGVRINTQMLAPHTKTSGSVSFDRVTGAYLLETPDSSMFTGFSAESTMNEYERMVTTLYNPASVPVKVLVNFQKPYSKTANYPDSGPAPSLRDAVTGEPIGQPVMISRNPHQYPVDPEPLYNATWANFYTYLTLLPGQALQFEYTMAYANWGETFAASVAHLCLIGWGVNQSWIVSSIGSFGEAFCYDPDRSHKVSVGTDGHALLCLPNSYGTLKKYTWTPGPGGSDYFLYQNENNQRQHLVNIKAEYESYAPNIARFTLNGVTLDGKARAELTFTLGRTNDVNKVLQHFRYTVLEDLAFTRLAFYQCGADFYNDSTFRTTTYGDASGQLGVITVDPNAPKQSRGYMTGCTNIPIGKEGLWISQNNSGALQDGHYTGISRAMVLREYRAQLNGKTYLTPELSFVKTNTGAGFSLIAELTAPKELGGVLKAGSTVEGTVEYFMLPPTKDCYYGPSEVLRSVPDEFFDTWQLIWEYARKGAVAVTAQTGTAVSAYPVTVQCAAVSSGEAARFTVDGGMGYVPVRLLGVAGYDGWRLYRVAENGAEELVDQSVLGNDYWQCKYNAETGLFDFGFNVEHNGNRETYVLRKAQ